MGAARVLAKVDELSSMFDDYSPEAREKYAGTHVAVVVHVPNEFAKKLTLRTVLAVEIESGERGESA